MKNPKTDKYSFLYFIAALEGKNFDEIEENNRKWAISFLSKLPSSIVGIGEESGGEHHGDCTQDNYSCVLCVLQDLLEQYSQYYFHEEEFRKSLGE